MTRFGIVTSVLCFLLAGCGSMAPADTTTTSVVAAGPAPPTSSPGIPVLDLCRGTGMIWEVGTLHVAPCFMVPLSFTVDSPGWRTSRVTLEAIEGLWLAPDERAPAIRWMILAFLPESTPSEIIDTILTIDGIDPVGEVTGDEEAASITVDTQPLYTSTASPCIRNAAWALHLGGGAEPGYILLDRGSMSFIPQTYGLGACRRFGIRAIRVEDTTITLISTTDDLDRFDELLPIVDQLVDGIAAAKTQQAP